MIGLAVMGQKMIPVKAGQPVDDLIEKLIPLLEPGDIVIRARAHKIEFARSVQMELA
jgi:6-phosphogluconate dehydrogenase